MGYLIEIVVLDTSNSTMKVYNVDSDWNNERIEEFVVKKGHKLSEADWAVIKHFPKVYHVTYFDNSGDVNTWGYLTKKAFRRSLKETNIGRSDEDMLYESDFNFEKINIQY